MPRQDSLEEQVKDVAALARRIGAYDAEDWIWRHWHNQSASTLQAVKSTYERRRPPVAAALEGTHES